MTRYPVWMDCDTGTDDAIAILLAHSLKQIDLLGLSAVCGNTSQANAYTNTLRVLNLVGADYPVYRGAEKPLIRAPLTASALGTWSCRCPNRLQSAPKSRGTRCTPARLSALVSCA